MQNCKNDKNKLNQKIKKFAMGMTLVACFSSLGIGIYDAAVDHTKEVCVITEIMNTIGLDGYSHQIKKMENEYHQEGENALVSYDDLYTDYNFINIIAPIKQEIDGKIIYSLPNNYVLVTINDKKYIISYNDIMEPEKQEINGQDIYSVPDNYFLTTINDEVMGVKINEQQMTSSKAYITQLENGKTRILQIK